MDEQNPLREYEIKVGLLGHEVFAVSVKTSDTSNRYMAIGLVSVFCILTLMGAYGDKVVSLYTELMK